AVLTAEGRAFPVAIEYDEEAAAEVHLATRVARALRRILDDPGDVLVFFPGAAEIRRAAEAIGPLAAARGLDVVTLHGDQPLDAGRACRPARRGDAGGAAPRPHPHRARAARLGARRRAPPPLARSSTAARARACRAPPRAARRARAGDRGTHAGRPPHARAAR